MEQKQNKIIKTQTTPNSQYTQRTCNYNGKILYSSSTQDRSMTSLLHLLHNSDDTGLENMYPLVCTLFSIATTLPLSTAEVERVFSQVKLIKTSRRNSIKTKTLNHLLNIKLNCDKTMFEHDSPTT